jgi:hypothetical protein
MGFKDTMRTNAESLARKGKEAGVKGQAKMESMQAKRRGDALLHDLGAAFYLEQRLGGSADATRRMVAVLDEHAAEHGLDTSPDIARPGTASNEPASAPTERPRP